MEPRKGAYHCVLFLIALLIHCNDASFSRANTGVLFRVVNTNNGSIDAPNPNDLIPMISLIASKFTKLTVALYYKAISYEVLVPSAVATYNKFHLKAGESPMELSITFVVIDSFNEQSANGSPSGWDSAIKILDEANQIFPGTIKRIYVEYIREGIRPEEEQIKELENFFAKANFSTDANYELGISTRLPLCGLEGLQEVLKHCQHLSFENSLIEEEHENEEPQVVIQKFLKEATECKRIIEGYGMGITIQIQTGWGFYNQRDRSEQDRNLVRYWDELNHWAESSNTSVLLWEAFEFPEEFAPMGLWRLVPNPHYKHVAEYVFEEKSSMPTSSQVP